LPREGQHGKPVSPLPPGAGSAASGFFFGHWNPKREADWPKTWPPALGEAKSREPKEEFNGVTD